MYPTTLSYSICNDNSVALAPRRAALVQIQAMPSSAPACTCIVVVVVEPAVDDDDVAGAGGAPQEGYEPRQHLVQVVLPDEHQARVLAQVKVPPAARARLLTRAGKGYGLGFAP